MFIVRLRTDLEIATELEDEDEDDSGLQETTKHLDTMKLPTELEVDSKCDAFTNKNITWHILYYYLEIF